MSIPYEFTAEDSVVISRAGTRARVWGILTLIMGLLPAVLAVIMMIEGLPVAYWAIYLLVTALPIYLGFEFMRAGKELRQVVSTEGQDVTHLLAGLDNLSKAFALQIGVGVFFLVFTATSMFIAITAFVNP